MNMGINADALLLLALGHLQVDHGYLDADAGVGHEFFLRPGDSALLQDHFADGDEVAGFPFVEIALINELSQLVFRVFGDVLWGKSLLL